MPLTMPLALQRAGEGDGAAMDDDDRAGEAGLLGDAQPERQGEGEARVLADDAPSSGAVGVPAGQGDVRGEGGARARQQGVPGPLGQRCGGQRGEIEGEGDTVRAVSGEGEEGAVEGADGGDGAGRDALVRAVGAGRVGRFEAARREGCGERGEAGPRGTRQENHFAHRILRHVPTGTGCVWPVRAVGGKVHNVAKAAGLANPALPGAGRSRGAGAPRAGSDACRVDVAGVMPGAIPGPIPAMGVVQAHAPLPDHLGEPLLIPRGRSRFARYDVVMNFVG